VAAAKAPEPPRRPGAVLAFRSLAICGAVTAAAAAPGLSQDGPSSHLCGDWRIEMFEDIRCETNPHRNSLSEDGRTVRFAWANPVDTLDGAATPTIDYRLDGIEGDRLRLTRTDTGDRAEMEFEDDGAAYRWRGGNDGAFHDGYRRCALAGG
jgi:hypothetical protein